MTIESRFLRIARIPLAAVFALAAFTGTAAERHGIIPGDIDTSADPCDDFYQYANGKWRKDNAIPAEMDRWSRRWQSGETNKGYVRDILAGLSAKTDWPKGSAEQLAGDFYAACMDESAIDELGAGPIEPWLADIAAIEDRKGVVAMLARMHEVGAFVPFLVYAGEDLHDPSRTIAHIYAGGLGMPDRDYYLGDDKRFVEARAKYLVHVAKMFELAGVDPPVAKRHAATVFAMEKRLAEASLDNVARRDPKQQDHMTPYADLPKVAPGLDWDAYFDAAKIPKNPLNVTEPKFLAQAAKELSSAPLEDVKTYLQWHLLNNAADTLSKPFVEEKFAFNGRFLSGTTELKPRWKRCAELTDSLLGEALGKAYVDRHFPPEAKARMQDMVKNILLAMDDVIDGLEWMDAETKKKALEKRASFVPKIGYPDKWKQYKGVEVTREDFFGSVVSASRWNIADNRSQIGKPTDRTRWGMTPPTSNAYYNPLQNEIVFPAGILQPPAFDVKATDAVNYGAIGVVIGHEISHGFDDQGAQFDASGRLKNWWTAKDLKQFAARGQCVVDQFEGYFIEPGIHHNGKLVLGEAIGDLAGAKIAFLAYRKSREGKGPEPTIDGFTPEQQFFIAWGQWRGDEIRPETQRTMVQGDPHPVAKYRVNGPLANLPQFAEAFECKAGDPMVREPEKRCEVW